MVSAVEHFAYDMLVNVFNAGGTAPLAAEAILEAGSHDLGSKGDRIEDPADWTPEKIAKMSLALDSDKGPAGDFDD